MLSNIWVWDPGSEIRKKPIPDPGSPIQGSKRHRIPDPDPQHCQKFMVSDPDLDPAPDPFSRVTGYVSSHRKKKVHRRNGHDYGMVRYNTALSRISN
jgi:hypothetical protein